MRIRPLALLTLVSAGAAVGAPAAVAAPLRVSAFTAPTTITGRQGHARAPW